MNKVQIITESASDITKEIAEKYNISIIPLVITCDGKEYLSGVDITPQEVYERTLNGEFFTTSQCSFGQLTEQFEKYAPEGIDIVYISVSSNLSGGYQSALMAREHILEKYPSVNIGVIDSYGGCMGQGLLVMRAAKLADEGKSVEEIVETIEKAKENIHYYITVDNFDALIRGGRVPKGVGVFADAIGIKPVISVIDGRLALIPKGAKQRGMKKCMNKILGLIEENVKINDRANVVFCHAYDTEKTEMFSAMFREKFGRDADYHIQLGPTIGVHGGPTAFAVFIDDFDA